MKTNLYLMCHTYIVRVKLRETFNGQGLLPGAQALDGKEFTLFCDGHSGPDEKYPGEARLSPRDNAEAAKAFYEADVFWIASGDLEFICEVEESRTNTDLYSSGMKH